ncbi:MAG: hypothetical protein RR971_03160, partial [Alistipes sp.]
MRKILNIIGLSSVVLLMASCDMDKLPQGNLNRDEAFKDLASIEYMEKGAYARMRDNFSVDNVLVS